jgi:hypothetical protein
MKKLLALFVAMLCSQAFAAVSEKQLPDPGSDGRNAKRVARVTYNISGNSAIWGSSTYDSGVHKTGVTIPAKSIITDSYLYIATALTATSGSPTIAFHCEDAANILGASSLTAYPAGTILNGKQYGSSSPAGDSTVGLTGGIAADCRITGTVSTNSYSAGKLVLFVEYVVGM